MKIVVDENIPLADAFFSSLGTVIKKNGRSLKASDIVDADVLLVRSVTAVNEALLANTAVKFVGSATIGVDHVDTDYLKASGIAFSAAPGCNAQAVVNYVCVCLFELSDRYGLSLPGLTVGIVGLGNVGSLLKLTLEALGLSVLACDPPLQSQGIQGLVSMDAVSQADIVTFHTPLITSGPYKTYHLADYAFLTSLKKDTVLINTSRGAVIDNQALKRVLAERTDLLTVLDVWENEPLLDVSLAKQVNIATPHIAGYSYDGKVKGTDMIYQSLCHYFKKPIQQSLEMLIPTSAMQTLDPQLLSSKRSLTALEFVRSVYSIMQDDADLRDTFGFEQGSRRVSFDTLRKNYRIRREFGSVNLVNVEWLNTHATPQLLKTLCMLGFNVDRY